MLDEDVHRVRPVGLAVRGRRHRRGWSPRALIEAIEAASRAATGIPETITPNLLEGIEDRDEIIPYETLCLVAAGLDCDPVDILGEDALAGVENAG